MCFGYPRQVPSQNHVFENAKRTSAFGKVGGQVRHQRPGPRWTGLLEVGGGPLDGEGDLIGSKRVGYARLHGPCNHRFGGGEHRGA